MNKDIMRLKALVKNIALKNKVTAQSVLQIFMLERLLERISISKYRDNFILKGGMLIAAMLGIESRTTMDMDTTIKGFPLKEDMIKNIITEICNINIDDNVTFIINNISVIRQKDQYGGYRISLIANYYNELPVNLKIDITTGDKVTNKEINYKYNLLLTDKVIDIWSYNIETVLAEKFNAIISLGITGTRMRDYYDLYQLLNFYSSCIDKKILKNAILNTSIYRNNIDLIDNWKSTLILISEDDDILLAWKKYTKSYGYAKGINFIDVVNSIKRIGEIYDLKE